MKLKPLFGIMLGFSLALTAPAEVTAADGRKPSPVAACVEQLSEDFTLGREAEGLDGVVTPAHIAEFGNQCRKSPAIAQSSDRDAARCVSRHLLWSRQSQANPQPIDVKQLNTSCLAAARAVPAENATIPGFARKRGNLFTHPKTGLMFAALAPRGSSGAADAPPLGNFQSGGDGSYAYTATFENLRPTILLVDLATDRAILCRARYNGGGKDFASNWTAFYYFDDQPVVERNEFCPSSLFEFSPSILLNWRQHLATPTSTKTNSKTAATTQTAAQPVAGIQQFSGHCNGFILAGHEYMQPGRCPNAISLFIPAPGESGRPRLTIKSPAMGAPTLVFQLDQAVQQYISNDIITFDVSPVSGLPFSWSAYDRLQCVFVKSPSDASVAAGSRYQPSATLNCSFQGDPVRDADKLVFAFIADAADIAAFRAAFVEAHDKLNPGRPYVSPQPSS